MPRFFIEKGAISPDFMELTGENAAHAKVLRLKCGDEVTVCDGDGMDYLCVVEQVEAGRLGLRVEEVKASESEPKVQCSVYMALPKADKLEHVIQRPRSWERRRSFASPRPGVCPVPMKNPCTKSWSVGRKLPLRRRSSPVGDGSLKS